MIFASLIIEREPLQWSGFPAALASWLQDAGVVAELAIGIGLLIVVLQLVLGERSGRIRWSAGLKLFALGAVLAQVGFIVFGMLWLVQGPSPTSGQENVPWSAFTLQDWALTLGGACALFAFVVPVVVKCVRLRWRRIWALARLSFKEAVHRRVVWVFCLMGLVFLFAAWFIPAKAEDQVRTYVTVVYFVMSALLLLTGSLLGAFSIPTDVRNQTIHTIVTKPVERYEIVLGRFLGYGLLLTVVLAVLTGVSLLYVVRGVTEEAKEESYKARVPVFGSSLSFYGTKDSRGESVGREWDYRKYLPGPNPKVPNQPRPQAIWSFPTLPHNLADRVDPVRFEFTFDIFRTTKGEIGKGVFCTLTFVTGHLDVPQIEALAARVRHERTELRKKTAGAADSKAAAQRIEDQLLAQYGLYEASGVEVTDYHTQSLLVPASLFKKVIDEGSRQQAEEEKLRDKERQDLEEARRTLPPAEYRRLARTRTEEQAQRAASKPYLKVLVAIDRDRSSRAQLLGVARRDLYLLAAELPFWQNFVKGAIGLWFGVLLILGLAVACSTYLSGIISWFCAMSLFLSGFFLDYIRSLATGTSVAGGPMTSLFRIANRMNLNAPLEDTPTVSVARGGDQLFSSFLHIVLKVIPDVNRFDLTNYVRSGFDIPWMGILFLDNLLPLVAYLLPWAVLGYYLMEQREVANPS